MSLLTLVLVPTVQAGACNCGVDYYLARAIGDDSVKPEFPDDCHVPEGEKGELMCVYLEAWNPYASGQDMDLQHGRIETVLKVVADNPDQADSASAVFAEGALWRMDPKDDLYGQVSGLVQEHDEDKWTAGAKVASDAGALQDIILDCDAGLKRSEAMGTRMPYLGDLTPSSAYLAKGTPEELRGRLNCNDNKPWRVWTWLALSSPIDVDAFWFFDHDDLVFARNAVFARHGRPFKTPTVKALFNELGGHWYKADDAYSDDRLSDLDKANVAIMQAYEDAIEAGSGHADAVKKAQPLAKPEPAKEPAPAKVAEKKDDSGCSALGGAGGLLLGLGALVATRRRG